MKNRLFFLFALAALFFSCSDDLQNENESKYSSDGQTYLVVNTASLARSLAPSDTEAKAENLVDFVLKGTRKDDSEITLAGAGTPIANLTALSSEKIPIQTGIWSFTLYAKLNDVDFSGTTESKILAGETNSISFSMTSVKDSGGMNVSLSFTDDSDSLEKVQISLWDAAEENKFDSKTILKEDFDINQAEIGKTSYSVTYNRSILDSDEQLKSGTYYLVFEFYAEGTSLPLNTVDYLVRVARGFTTKANQTIKLNQTYEIRYDANDDVESPAKLASGEVQINKYSRKSEDIILPQMTREGYIFGGWCTDNDLTKSISKIPSGSTESLTLYAKWFEPTLYVDANGSSENDGFKLPLDSIESAVNKIIEVNLPELDWKIFVSGQLIGCNEISADFGHAKSLTIEGSMGSINSISEGYTDILYGGGTMEKPLGAVVTVNSAVPIIFKNIKITGGYTQGDVGGGIDIKNMDADVTLDSGTWVTDNCATNGSGGGIFTVRSKDLKLTMKSGSVISNNKAYNGFGGGLYSGGAFYMLGGLIENNAAYDSNGNSLSRGCALCHSYTGCPFVIDGDAYIPCETAALSVSIIQDVRLADWDGYTIIPVTVGSNLSSEHATVAMLYTYEKEAGKAILLAEEGKLSEDDIQKFALVQENENSAWYIDKEGKLALPAAGGTVGLSNDSGVVNIILSGDTMYLNKGISFTARDKNGELISNADITYSAQLLYKGKTLGDDYYYVYNDDMTKTAGITFGDTDLPKDGSYQLYVTAMRQMEGIGHVCSSQTFDIKCLLEDYFISLEFNVSDSDFNTKFGDAINSIDCDANIVLTGEGSNATISTVFNKTASTSDSYNVTVDMSAVTGIESLSQMSGTGAYVSISPCLVKLILPDTLTTIGDYAFSTQMSSSGESRLILSLGTSVSSISLPFSGDKSPFCGFEVAEDNKTYKTNSDGSMILNKDGDTIVWAADKYGPLTIPDEVTKIGKGAFYGCSNIASYSNMYSQNITLNNVACIEEYAFNQCNGKFVLTETLVAAGSQAFSSYATITDNSTKGTTWYYVTDKNVWTQWIDGTLTPGVLSDSSPTSETSAYVTFKNIVSSSGSTNYMYRHLTD